MTTPEGKIKVLVTKALSTLSTRCYRFMPVQNGMGAPGLDYYNCIDGKFVAIETKVLGKKLTPRQKITAIRIMDAGGFVFVVRNKDDVDEFLRAIFDPGSTTGFIYDTEWDDREYTEARAAVGKGGTRNPDNLSRPQNDNRTRAPRPRGVVSKIAFVTGR